MFNAFIDTLKLRPESALYRTVTPDWAWGLPELLSADIADSLHLLVWLKAGGKKSHRPKQIPRPGVEQPERVGDKTSIADMNQFLGWEVPA